VIVQFLDTRPAEAAWQQSSPQPEALGERQLRPGVQILVARMMGVLVATTDGDARHHLRLTLPKAEA
jgi:hypothetical protein